MSNYPSTSPFGPHGPQVGANTVTPNPTPAYQPPVYTPPTPSYHSPQPSRSSYSADTASTGRAPASSGGVAMPARPFRKSMLLGVLLSWLLGPLGLLYAVTGGSRGQLIAALLFSGAYAYGMVTSGSTPVWLVLEVVCVTWTVVAISRRNRNA